MTKNILILVFGLIVASCGDTTSSQDIDKSKLSKELLQEYRWEERLSTVNCSIIYKFISDNGATVSGCNIIGDPKIKYYISSDTLIMDQYKNDVKWITGKYLYNGHSLSIFKAIEWQQDGVAKELDLPKVRGPINPVEI